MKAGSKLKSNNSSLLITIPEASELSKDEKAPETAISVKTFEKQLHHSKNALPKLVKPPSKLVKTKMVTSTESLERFVPSGSKPEPVSNEQPRQHIENFVEVQKIEQSEELQKSIMTDEDKPEAAQTEQCV